MNHSGPIRIVLAGGGTGGHLFPGIAVARALLRRAPGAQLTFVGTARGIEARVIPREGFALELIRSRGLKRQAWGDLVRGLATLPLSVLDAWRILRRCRPDLVIGLGGYSSAPVVLLAAARRVPTMLLEQNAIPGLANRVSARVVSAAAVTFEESLPYFRGSGFVSGNPVRPEFFEAGRMPTEPRASDEARVLIFGGSQGAHAINVAMVEAAPFLALEVGRVAVTHQTGERDLTFVRSAYEASGLRARVEPFFDEMGREMAAADLVVCRAGATTLAELAAVGRPALLVPLPTAADDHQRRNAEVLARSGAAEVIHQRDLTGPDLARRVVALAADRHGLAAMGQAMRRFARPEAADMIAERALTLAGRRKGKPLDG